MPALQYRPAIDGLRALAVLSVFVFHLNHQWLPGGFVGVDIFFVISGYLITSIILHDCNAGTFSLLKFYQRRIARIFPAFFTVALATLVGAKYIYTPQDFASAGANLTAASLSIANLKYMLQGSYFQISPDAQPFLHYWSLSVEEQFYLFFPLLFLLLFKYARKHLVSVLGIIGSISLLACILLTPAKPVWAFFLLPTRAWELCAGSLLAVIATHPATTSGSMRRSWIPLVGLLLVALSFVFLHEGPQFPGWRAILPVAGAVALLLPSAIANSPAEKWLSAPPLVRIGRMSYSLYLWHWPIFSLVDYQFFLSSEPLRLTLKIGLSFLAAVLSFLVIENPTRRFLNDPKRRLIAYTALTAALAICVPLGISIRKANYVNAELRDVAKGGLVFPGKPGARSIVLMGDSNGSMYGKVMKEICADLGYKLTVISVAGGDPLPSSTDQQSQLWLNSLAAVQKAKPDVLVLACHWESKLKSDMNRLAVAVPSLKPYAVKIVILNQPPILPESANRASIRNGVRPPFTEDISTHQARLEANDLLRKFSSIKISVVDIATSFQLSGGEVRVLDDQGYQLYHDATHLSGYGAHLIRPLIQSALLPTLN
ncbi:MAG: acyltransferase family protein [Deltaproteobacteria bacterium]